VALVEGVYADLVGILHALGHTPPPRTGPAARDALLAAPRAALHESGPETAVGTPKDHDAAEMEAQALRCAASLGAEAQIAVAVGANDAGALASAPMAAAAQSLAPMLIAEPAVAVPLGAHV